MLKATLQQRPFLLLSHHHLSFFPHVCFCLSSTCLSVCLFLRFSLSVCLSELSAISADCHIVCVCLLACFFVCESKVRHVPEEVKWVLWPSVLINSWTELHACVGGGHSCRVKRALTKIELLARLVLSGWYLHY